MAEFAVKTHQLRSCASQLSGVERELDAVSARLGSLQLGCVLQIRASMTLINRVNDCRRAVANQSDNLGKLARGMETIAGLYDACERNLSEPGTGQTTTDSSEGGSTVWDWLEGAADTAIEFGSWLTDILGEESGGFSILHSLFAFADGDVAEGVQSLFESGSRTIRAVFDLTDGGINADWVDDLFGLGDNASHGWGNAWNNLMDDLGFGSRPATTAGTVATVCQWAGYAMSFVASGFQNYEEFDGDMGNARFWGETVLEGAVDVGLGIGAGVAAAALIPATWPAIAVGAAAGLAVWGVNEVCEWITGGDDLGEVVANVVCDGVEAAVDVAQDIGRSIVDGANAVCDWFGSLW